MKEISNEEERKRLAIYDKAFEKRKGYIEYQKELIDFEKSMEEKKYLFDQMMRILKPKFLGEMEKFIRNENGSALDFFIMESVERYEITKHRKNYYSYRLFWKMFEQYYFDVIKKR